MSPSPSSAALSKPSPTKSTDAPGGYSKAEYQERLGDIPSWIGKTRDNMDKGYEMTVGVDLSALGDRFEEVGRLPCPSGIDPAYWYAATRTLADFSWRAADEWRHGDGIAASARLQVIVDESNEFLVKANKALGLSVPRS